MTDVGFILCEARNPYNIGACARALANFGFSKLSLIDVFPQDLMSAKEELLKTAEISAVDSDFVLEKAAFFANVEEAISDCDVVFGTSSLHRMNPKRDVVSLPVLADFIADNGYDRPAILFGNEKRGLTNQQLGYCNYIINIPTFAAQPSMNLGQAVAVVAYELSRLRNNVSQHRRENKDAPPRQIYDLASQIQEALIRNDGDHWHEETRLREIRQSLLDARMTAQAVNALKAVLKKL